MATDKAHPTAPPIGTPEYHAALDKIIRESYRAELNRRDASDLAEIIAKYKNTKE